MTTHILQSLVLAIISDTDIPQFNDAMFSSIISGCLFLNIALFWNCCQNINQKLVNLIYTSFLTEYPDTKMYSETYLFICVHITSHTVIPFLCCLNVMMEIVIRDPQISPTSAQCTSSVYCYELRIFSVLFFLLDPQMQYAYIW